MITIAVINLKGGSTKTTTAGFLLAALHESNLRVLGVDADGENAGLSMWQTDADLPWPVMGLAVANLHKQLPELAADRFDVAVIDTPPMKAQRGTVMSAVRAATHVVVPTAPTPPEYDRVPTVAELIAESAGLRGDGESPPWAILFTKCKASAASPAVYRARAEADGYPVLRAQVGNLERFAQAQGSPIVGALNSSYGDAAFELLDMGQESAA